MKKKYAVGIDFGGTNIRLGLVQRTSKGIRVIDQVGCASRAAGRPQPFMRSIRQLMNILLRRHGLKPRQLAGIGVGMPGSVNTRQGLVHFLPNVKGWKNVPVQSKMQKIFHCPIVVDNDVNAMAQGEFFFGAARGCRNAVFLTLGTGLGGGLLINGKPFHGESFSAAEIGHLTYRAGGRTCACGQRGCIETEIGNAYLVKRVRRDIKSGKKTLLKKMIDESPEKKLEVKLIAMAAKRGDRYAIGFWKGVGQHLGHFLGGICNLLNPEKIVIGGGVGQVGHYLFGPLNRTLKASAFPAAARHVRVVKARFGADAGIVGAASMVFGKKSGGKS
jgi:glucokinase